MKEVSVVLVEFNELSPILMEKWMAQGLLPNFKQFWSEATVEITECEERPPALEPWVQWITAHSGLSFRAHKIFHLGDGNKLKEKCIWDTLSDTGYRVWICGSMNATYHRPLNGYFLPDPWSTNVEPYPLEFVPYFKFVQKNVMEYSNDRLQLTKADYLQFLMFMIKRGLSIRTVAAIVKQLFGERLGRTNRWRRAVILDKLQFDVFRWYFRKFKPAFSTFFLNSTAHFQHFYWRNMEPSVFKVQPTDAEQAEFGNAILFGYQEMDQLLGEFVKLAGRETTLIMCTALSQQPCLTYEDSGGKVIYRPRDFDALLAFAGINEPCTASPVMAEEFFVYAESEKDAISIEQKILGLRLDDRTAFRVRRVGTSIYCGCGIFEAVPQSAELSVDGRKRPFYELLYQIEGVKSGMHHPDGMFWVRSPERVQHLQSEKLPLTSVAGKILELFGVQSTNYSRHVDTVEPVELSRP